MVMLFAGTHILVLVAGRILQGLSASTVFTVGLALISDTVDREEIGQFLGFLSSSANIALLISPLLGGVVYSQAGYYPVFAMIFGLIIFDIIIRLVMIEKKCAAKWTVPAENDGHGARTDYDQAQGQDRRQNDSVTISLSAERATEERCSISSSEERWPLLKTNVSPTRSASRTSTLIRLLKSPRLLAAMCG